MGFCEERGIECKPDCTGPVVLKTEIVGTFEGAGSGAMIDIASSAVKVVCSLDIQDRIALTDWVHDEADVTGMVFANDPREVIPARILTITPIEGN